MSRSGRSRAGLIPVSPESGDPPAEAAPARWRQLVLSPAAAMGLLLVVSLWCRIVWLSNPGVPHVFDEVYYVNAARIIDGFHVAPGDHYAGSPVGLDPNQEHPPLGKAILATSMHLFGDDPTGWRLPSVLAGMLAILLLYLLITAGGGDAWMGVLGASLFSFDNLVLVQSRIGMLDIFVVLFLLLGAWGYLRHWPLLAGVGLALATNVKIAGLYGLLAILLAEGFRLGLRWYRSRTWRSADLEPAVILLATFIPVWLGGLWLLDLKYSAYHNPFDHLRYIFQYGAGLTRSGGPAFPESYPWQWLVNEVQIEYFKVTVTITSGPNVFHRYPVLFRGAMNPVIIGSASLGFFYAAWRAWKYEDRLSLWVVAWVLGTYLPYYPLIIVQQRIGYLYYFLLTLPAVVVGLAQFFRDKRIPPVVTLGFLALVIVDFIAYFPFRTILQL